MMKTNKSLLAVPTVAKGVLLCSILLISQAYGSLFESPNEITKRYGPPVDGKDAMFQADHIGQYFSHDYKNVFGKYTVTVTFVKLDSGPDSFRSEYELFHKTDNSVFSDTEIQAIIALNATNFNVFKTLKSNSNETLVAMSREQAPALINLTGESNWWERLQVDWKKDAVVSYLSKGPCTAVSTLVGRKAIEDCMKQSKVGK